MRNLKQWFYRRELSALETLAFETRLRKPSTVLTAEWRSITKSLGVECDFEKVRYWLDEKGFVTYTLGMYLITEAGATWYQKIAKRRLVY